MFLPFFILSLEKYFRPTARLLHSYSTLLHRQIKHFYCELGSCRDDKIKVRLSHIFDIDEWLKYIYLGWYYSVRSARNVVHYCKTLCCLATNKGFCYFWIISIITCNMCGKKTYESINLKRHSILEQILILDIDQNRTINQTQTRLVLITILCNRWW